MPFPRSFPRRMAMCSLSVEENVSVKNHSKTPKIPPGLRTRYISEWTSVRDGA